MYQERVIRERARLVSSTEPVGSSAHRGFDVPRRCQASDRAAGSESPMAQLVVKKKIMMMVLTILIFDFPIAIKKSAENHHKNGQNKSEPYTAN